MTHGAECLNLGERERSLFPHAEPKQSLPLVSSPVEHRDGKEVFEFLVQVVGLVGGEGDWRWGVGVWCSPLVRRMPNFAL